MEIKEAIILAGGLGTRLRSSVPDLPKCMAPVNGRPFLSYIINYYRQQGIEKFIFSLGYKHEVVSEWFTSAYPGVSVQFVIEDEPLGTGGAIQLAAAKATEKKVLVLNGDTIFKIDLAAMADFQQTHASVCTLSLKPMEHFDRYGAVDIDKDNRIQSFKEKKYYIQGLINGGVYLLDVSAFLAENKALKFSFEKDYLEADFARLPMYGFVQDTYFIDIGIPADFERAQEELREEY